MNAGTVPFHGGSPGIQKNLVAAPLQGGGVILPITLYVKNVPILTAGAPADIATITIPAGITRYITTANVATACFCKCFAETASGTLAAATFQIRDTPSGGGVPLNQSLAGPASAGLLTSSSGNSQTNVYTSTTIYINQIGNSPNAGTCSFYITIFPLP